MKSRLFCAFFVGMLALCLWAEDVSVSVADGTIDVAAGDTATNTEALTGDLVKTGAGKLVLNKASTLASGTITIKAGTVVAATTDCMGADAVQIVVEDGGTLRMEFARTTSDVFQHKITIAGKGVGELGAIQFYPTGGSGNTD